MPAKVTPKLLTPPPTSFTVDFEGFNFFRGRWEGEGGLERAEAVAKQFNRAGYTSAVFTASTKEWHRTKFQEFEYYKVWVGHATNKILYSWWEPENKDVDTTFPIKFDHPTWFEFEQPTAK